MDGMIMRDDRKENAYKRFKKSVLIDFGDIDIESKNELRELMTQYGYRRKKDGTNLYATDKQVDTANNWLKKSRGQRIIDDYFKVETYNKRIIRRAMKNIVLNGKEYRKGQFLPKRR